MTANVATEDVRRCYEVGMDAFLPKPIDVASLARMLGGLIAAPAAAAVVDTAVVGRLCEEIGSDIVRELTEEFLADVKATLPDLEEGCRAQDRLRVAAAAHKLKSPARSLGAVGFGDLLDDLEHRAADSDWPTLARMVGRLGSQQTGLHDQLRDLAR
jgi:HPt (histidine-containing phosphotransfer) domain-containing protein